MLRPQMHNLLLTVIAVLASGAGVARAQLADSSWPMFGHDPQHSGRTGALGARDNVLQWRSQILTSASDHIAAPVLGEDGTLYVGTMNRDALQGLWAVNPDGTSQWHYSVPIRIIGAAAVANDGSIVTAAADHRFYRVNDDGSERWAIDPNLTANRDFGAAPTIAPDGGLLIGRQNDGFWSFNGDGSVRWNFRANAQFTVRSSAALTAEGAIIFGANDGFVYSLNAAGGENWRLSLNGEPIDLASPAIATDGTIYIGTLSDGLFAINPGGSILWSFAPATGVSGAPAIASDGTIYVAASNHTLYAINPDGSERWNYSTDAGSDALATSSPVISGDRTIYASLDTATLFAIRPDGTELWRFAAEDSILGAAAIGTEGTIYFGSNDGYLYAVGTRDCVSDLTGDRLVGLDDLAILLSNFGLNEAALSDGDIDGDGDVDLADLAKLLADFGTTCS